VGGRASAPTGLTQATRRRWEVGEYTKTVAVFWKKEWLVRGEVQGISEGKEEVGKLGEDLVRLSRRVG